MKCDKCCKSFSEAGFNRQRQNNPNPVIYVCNICYNGRTPNDCDSFKKDKCEIQDYSSACINCSKNQDKKCWGNEGENCNRPAKIRRTNAAYVVEHMNYVSMCDECFKEEQKYWAEMWSNYYNEIM